jgi:ATP-dependent DNA helicase RecQ
LLNYDSGGEVPENLCCDVCDKEPSSAGDMREEKTVLDFFRRNKRRFTQNEAASALAASETIRWSQEETSRVIGYLIKTNKLKRIKWFPWKNKISL